ncbi:MAG: YkgJ family cysteine cluster protein [Betaproteobacteria bacterium]
MPTISSELQAIFDRERADATTDTSADAGAARTHTIRMHGRLDALQRRTIELNHVTIECSRGCSYCCHLRVEIRPHDAFVLAEHLRRTCTAVELAAVLERLRHNLARIASLSADEHIRAGIPCALLKEGACTAYEARPATCRKYHSVSVATCRDAYHDTSAPLTGEIEDERVRLAGNAVALGYAKGLDDSGFDAGLYEFHFALQRALTDARAEKRYRHRKRAFAGGA